MTAMQTARASREAVGSGARGLAPEGERELIARLSETAISVVERDLDRMNWRSKLAAGFKGALIGAGLLALGFAGGRYFDRGGQARALEGAAFMAQIASLNDLRVLQEQCNRTARQQTNGMACDLPPVWVRRTGR